jgi:stage V sporulation protein B
MGTKKSFISGAVILMISGLIVRLLGFVYRIYISNLLGSEGMGLFQLISPVYSLIILTLTSGVSIAVSKMTAREMARRHFVNIRRITLIALLVVFAAGTAISLLLLLNTGFIANMILKEPRTYYSILLLKVQYSTNKPTYMSPPGNTTSPTSQDRLYSAIIQLHQKPYCKIYYCRYAYK